MSNLSKLNFLSVQRSAERDLVAERRAKFIAAIEEQRGYLEMAMAGQKLTRIVEKTHEDGSITKRERPLRVWFFEKVSVWYLQARYGARQLLIDGKSNAIQVAKQADLIAVLDVLEKATLAGELDAAFATATKRKGKSHE